MRTMGYTVYTGIASDNQHKRSVSNIPPPIFKTRKAVVFYQRTTRRYLTPMINNSGHVEHFGLWNNTQDDLVAYGLLKAEVSGWIAGKYVLLLQ